MNVLLISTILAIGQGGAEVAPPPSTALDGVWTVVALEINGRPAPASERGKSLAIRNNTLTLPGIAAIHGTIRLDLGPQGTLRAVPAANGTGNRRDSIRNNEETATGITPSAGTSTGVIGAASGVYVRTADYLVLTIGDPSTATATGTGIGETTRPRSINSPNTTAASPAGESIAATVGQPPVSLVLRRSTGADAAPSTAETPPPAATPPAALPAPTVPAPAPGAGPGPAATAMRRASAIMGTNVNLSDGSSAGPIEDIVYDNNGMIGYAVVGINGSFAAVPWYGLSWDAGFRTATLPLTRDQFGAVPTFGVNGWTNLLTNAEFAQRLQGTFNNFQDANGRPLFANSMNRMNGQRNMAGSTNGNRQGNMPANRSTNQPGRQAPNQPGPQPPQPGGQPGAQQNAQPGASPGVPPKSGPKPGLSN